jgi:cysteine desulfurase/selenocysteine lyase
MKIADIRRQFPVLSPTIVYLDNAATTQKPQVVLDAMEEFYRTSNANINRGVHALGEKATIAYDESRDAVRRFINAAKSHEVIFTRNTTESINLVAKAFARSVLKKNDVVVLSILEHHSNIVPWLQLQQELDIRLMWIDIDDEGMVDIDAYKKILEDHPVKIVSVTAVICASCLEKPSPSAINSLSI